MIPDTLERRFISELGTELSGRVLEIWDGRSDLPSGVEEFYRNALRKEAGKAQKVELCSYFGEDTGERVKCGPCADKGHEVRMKIFACSHPERITTPLCTIEPASPDVQDCLNCKKRPSGKETLQFLPEEVESLASELRAGFPDLNGRHHDLIRDAHVHIIREAIKNPPSTNRGEGRGIVMGVGGTLYFSCASVAVSVLRGLGCTLPLEWWHLGPAEIDPKMRSLAAELGVTCRDALEVASSLPSPPRILNGWELKPFSIAHSGFEEVLYLDADNICTQDPTPLFDSSQYKDHGAAFWPDLPPYDRKEWVPETAWKSVGLELRDETDFESGQLIVNKKYRSAEIAVTCRINDHSDFYYKFIYGDKTTFHLGWRVCSSDYAMPKRSAGWVWPAIQQHDFDGNLLFQHVCQGKQQLAEGKPLNLKRKREAMAAAKSLRDHWHGGIWSILDQTPTENAIMQQMIGQYQYTRFGIHGNPSRIIRLGAGGKIEEGAAGCEQAWSVRLLNDVPTLVITGEAHKGTRIAMMFLTESNDGVWRGRWQAHERGPVELKRL